MSIFEKSYKAKDDGSEIFFSASPGYFRIIIEPDCESDEIEFEIPIEDIENLKTDYYGE